MMSTHVARGRRTGINEAPKDRFKACQFESEQEALAALHAGEVLREEADKQNKLSLTFVQKELFEEEEVSWAVKNGEPLGVTPRVFQFSVMRKDSESQNECCWRSERCTLRTSLHRRDLRFSNGCGGRISILETRKRK